MKDLVIDPAWSHLECTGIYVRALGPDGRYGSFDIACLTQESLIDWLRSRGGENRWAEQVAVKMMAVIRDLVLVIQEDGNG